MKKTAKFLIILIGLFLIFAKTDAAPVLWPENGHYYEYVTTQLYWDQAKTAAESSTYNGMTGHLATITSLEENTFIFNNTHATYAYLGAYKPDLSVLPKTAGWQWITGETWNYASWASGEPNNAGGIENNAEYWGWSNGVWNDLPGARYTRGYIVEYEPTANPTPEPATLAMLGIGLVGIACKRLKKQ